MRNWLIVRVIPVAVAKELRVLQSDYSALIGKIQGKAKVKYFFSLGDVNNYIKNRSIYRTDKLLVYILSPV